MNKAAVLSQCETYRYELRRVWDDTKQLVLFVGLNPSVADANIEDPTSRVCIGYAQRWGFGGLLLGNLFAFRSTEQAGLFAADDPIGPENDAALAKLQSEAGLVVCAWSESGSYVGRDQVVLGLLRDPHCLVKLKSGQPGHPLYKKRSLQPIRYER